MTARARIFGTRFGEKMEDNTKKTIFDEIEVHLGKKITAKKILKSGWAGEIVSLSVDNDIHKYILKTYGSSRNGLQNIRREWQSLSFLFRANYPVPEPVLWNSETEDPYILMEEIKGENFWTNYQESPQAERQELLANFVEIFFRLHALDVSISGEKIPEGLAFDFIAAELAEIEKLTRGNNITGFQGVVDWLGSEKTQVTAQKPVIIHRDYHPWNVIAAENGALYVVDLNWGIGDYRFDLAWFCTLMERSDLQDFSLEAFELYRALKKSDIPNFGYFKVLASLRWLINVIISQRTGDNLNETRRAEFNDFISPLIKNGVRMIEEITRVKIEI
jgi:aminoglycoside phosphotransferase (APT) family kinase protein